jgi:hypothetical protein
MKTLKFIFFFLLLLVFKTGITQETWYPHYVCALPGNLNSVCFNNSHMNGVSCGDLGYIYGWRIIGDPAWFPVSSPTTKNLFSIAMIDSSSITKAYIVGENGIILKSNYIPSQAGFTFYIQISPTSDNLYSVFFTSYSTGISVGDNGTIIRTTDGGDNWSNLSPVTSNRLYSVNFPNLNTGYIAGINGTILKTTDNGITWIIKSQPANDTLRSICFSDDNTGIVVGRNGSIFKTTDGGNNWQSKTTGITENLNAVRFMNPLDAYAAGNNNKIVKTTNSGENWSLITLPPLPKYGNFFSIAKTYTDGIAVVGRNSTAAGTFPSSLFVSENAINMHFSVTPNPATNKITIQLQDAGRTLKGFGTLSGFAITICNLQGQILLQQSITKNNTEIDISVLQPGVYFACLLVDGVLVKVEKMIKN